MSKIEQLFKEKTKEITFIELRDNSSLDINGLKIEGGTPLPVITDNLIEEIQNNDLSEEIKLGQVVDGIIFLLGSDKDFPYIDIYISILKAYDPKIAKYIFYKGMKALETGELEKGGVYFRANIELEPKNLDARLNYGLVLESIAKDYNEKNKSKEGEEFLNRSTNEFETILEIDDKYSLAYYKLGYHYRYHEQFLKAKLTWNKFLLLDKDEARLQEIREQIDLIDDDVKIEVGLSYLSYNDFGKALDSLLKLLPKHKENWNVNYLIGICYKGIEDYELAIKYLNYALELNEEESDIYNELGITFFIQGHIIEAINIYNEGIEKTNDDYKLYFNRGLGFVQLGEYEKAINDINMAYELNPNDKNIAVQKQELENYLNTLN
ncbi:tetratricopeptide repeat protein [Tissierella sp. Yu-01]|uniref:tetratricopeptide repeat protein n=1 Tax=Tissierella sp. Yu-01 TaxID=3035694 RepID=UPI00240E43A9|nr:tetratricopeptide repeat protein [Tissierella sp. Yu-01]WFA09870.1 tetratricopeptide repeat protein [Tissierella sp. Yu-01]